MPKLIFNIYLESFVGVATVGVATLSAGLSASCLVVFLGSSAQKMASCVGVATLIVGAVVVMSYVCHPEGHVSLNIIEKIIPKPKIFTETRTQDSFWVCTLSSCNLLSETNKFCLDVVLLLCLVLELHKTSSSGLEPRRVFGVVALEIILKYQREIYNYYKTHRISVGFEVFTAM
jgi:hypothetical protein